MTDDVKILLAFYACFKYVYLLILTTNDFLHDSGVRQI